MGLEHDPGKPTIGDFSRVMARAGVLRVNIYRGIAGWFAGAELSRVQPGYKGPLAMVTGCHPTLEGVMLELIAWAESKASDARTGGA